MSMFRSARRTLFYVVLFALAVAWALPVLWALAASLRPFEYPLGKGSIWFAHTLTAANYARTASLAPFGHYYVNTVIVVTLTLAVQVVTITMAAYAFAHYEFPGKRVLFYAILLQMMIPTAALLVPNFATIRVLGLYNTRLAIALPFFGSAFGTFLMRQAFLAVPRSLVSAGILDGCSWWQLLVNVYLPPSMPTVTAFAISTISFHWNDFLWPLIITSSDHARPLTAGLVRFTQLGEIGAQWQLLSAATIMVAGPLFILFLVFQRRFIQSFVQSGLK
ncbi:MAG TPA: carbohydrate ABC transporter permease [Spirochaetia bacterium]|nr:carbohydrate ABC transporter permease [Spirochaetia bacterium]